LYWGTNRRSSPSGKINTRFPGKAKEK